MVELNPRPEKPNLFLQVSIAVISGAAAMYFISNFSAAPLPKILLQPQAAAAPETKVAQPPRPAEPAPPAAEPSDAEPARYKPAPPPESAMLIKPEPGGAEPGMVSVFGEDAPEQSATQAAKKEAQAASAAKPVPGVRLEHRAMRTSYASQAIGHDFDAPRLAAKIYAKPVKEKEKEKETPKAKPQTKSYPIFFDKKPIPQKDIFVPSLLHPEIVPEQPFWDYERIRKAVISGIITVSGIVYLLFAMGVISIGKRRVENDETR
jgi:hypothetical protein